MDNEYIERLRKQVKKALKMDKKRYRHTLGVADTAACLAMRYGADVEKAYIAGLLHDCAKCVPDDIKIKECQEHGIEITESEAVGPYLLHAKLGALYARIYYGIEDEEILSAIRFHTTGRANMTELEEIVFIADYIEPYRNQASDLNVVRAESFTDIRKAILTVTFDTLEYLKRKGKAIDPVTVETYEFYKDTQNN